MNYQQSGYPTHNLAHLDHKINFPLSLQLSPIPPSSLQILNMASFSDAGKMFTAATMRSLNDIKTSSSDQISNFSGVMVNTLGNIKKVPSSIRGMVNLSEKVHDAISYIKIKYSDGIDSLYDSIDVKSMLILLVVMVSFMVYHSCFKNNNTVVVGGVGNAGEAYNSVGGKWYQNMSEDDESRVTRRTGRGCYAIMACSYNECSRKAIFGVSRSSVPLVCQLHADNNMVKSFGCSVRTCSKRVVSGTLKCKDHQGLD